MCNFKVGEKVVFIGSKYDKDPAVVFPKINEVVTINGFSKINPGSLYISEYLVAKNGNRQSITSDSFRKLDWQFGHDICAELSRQYNEEFIKL